MSIIKLPEFGYTPRNLKELRIQFQLTQADVARIVGIKSPHQVSRWERVVDDGKDKAIRADMPYASWKTLIEHCKSVQGFRRATWATLLGTGTMGNNKE